jgi:hypothetical protein
MSVNIDTSFVSAFTERVHLAYQAGSKLGGTVREVMGVEGSTYRFDTYGKITAGVRIPLTPVSFSNPTVGNATATLANYNVSILSDKFDEAKTKWTEIEAAAQSVGMALGRRKDQVIMDAFQAATPVNTVAAAIGVNTAMNVGKLRRCARLLNEDGVPETDRHVMMRAVALEQLLGSTPATSGDYNTIKALVNGSLNSFLGFQFHIIESRDEGGIPLSSGTEYFFWAYHKSSLGYAEGVPPVVEIARESLYRSRAVYGDFSAGGVVVDTSGFVEGIYDEAIAVNVNES